MISGNFHPTAFIIEGMRGKNVLELIEQSAYLERSGQVGAALECARQSLEVARSDRDPDGMATALVRMGDLHYRMGHFAEVRDLGKQALACAGKESLPRVGAFIMLGNCSMEDGSLGEAETYYQTAADLSRQMGYDQQLVSALHDLAAGVYALRGQFDLAFTAEEEAYRIACQVNSPFKHFMLISMCFDSLLTGQYQRGKDILARILPLIKGDYSMQGHYAWMSAYIAQIEGDLPVAFELYNQVRPIAETTGDLGLNVFLRMGLSACHQMMGNASAAYDWANDAVSWASRVGTRRLLGRTLTERARSAWLKGDLSAAESDLRRAIQDLSVRQQAYDLARAYLLLAALLRQQNRPDADTAYLEAITLIVSGDFAYLVERERALAFPLVAHYLSNPDPTMQVISARLLAHLASAPPPPLRIFTLGRFEVYSRGRLIQAAAWRRSAGELFRLLLISPGRSLSREQVIDALWPEKSLSAATDFLYQATSGLRRALEPDLPDKFPSRYLLVEEGQVTLYLPSGSQVDFESFEEDVRKGEWEAALKLYQGEPFAKDRYHDWASWKREQLIQQGLRVLLAAATQSLEAGDAGQALTSCQRILAEEPWQEQATLLGMQACLKLNDRPGALRLYLSLKRCLNEEFGVLPMGELRDLYQSLVER
jgi:DNA-binding SARP family transcriptional activator